MDKGKMLWTVLGFGIALCVIGAAAYFLNTDGQPEDEEEEPVQPKGGVYLMMVEGIDGEAQDDDHKNWMILDTFGFPTIKVSGAGDVRTGGERTYEPIRIVKRIDKSSPKLMESCVNGEVIPKIVVKYCRLTETDSLVTVMAYEFTNVVINGYFHGSGNADPVPTEEMQAQTQVKPFFDVGKGWSPARPSESLSLNFEEIKVTYTELDSENKSKGNVEYTWKVEEGEV
ncbi:MAG: Hcp family type VI secretion system effector [Thermoplasmatota archaeon]